MNCPIAAAVEPCRQDAIKRAEEHAKAVIAKIKQDMANANWDLNEAAPYNPRGFAQVGDKEILQRRAMISALTKADQNRKNAFAIGGQKATNYRAESPAGEAKFIDQAKQQANEDYTAFVVKLQGKIGAVASAELQGNHVWDYSILRVTKQDGTAEAWKTQMIVNVSKLGLLFNQFPTRKVKA